MPDQEHGPAEDNEPVDGVTIEGREAWAVAASVLYLIGGLIAVLGIRVADTQVTGSALLVMLAGGVAHLKSR